MTIPSAPLIRPISHAAFELKCQNSFDRAVRDVVTWARNRSTNIPAEAFKGEPFQVAGMGINPTKAINFSSKGSDVWALSIDVADTHVPQRFWNTQTVVVRSATRTVFAARLLQINRGDDAEFVYTRPGCVRQVIDSTEAYIGRLPLKNGVTHIDTEEALDEVLLHLDDVKRPIPIVISSANEGDSWIDNDELAGRVSGAARVYTITPEMSWALTETAGRRSSVFGNALRIYAARTSIHDEDPFRHPLWIHQGHSSSFYVSRISQNILRQSNRDLGSLAASIPRFSALEARAESIRLSKNSQSKTPSEALLKEYEVENERLIKQLDDQEKYFNSLIEMANDELDELQRSRDNVQEEIDRLRSKLHAIQNWDGKQKDNLPGDETLKSYAEFDTWYADHLSSHIVIPPKTIKYVMKNAQFEDPVKLGRALLIMRNIYVPMRRGDEDVKFDDFRRELMNEGLDDAKCLSDEGHYKKYGYVIEVDGNTYTLERHIKYKGGQDPTRFFRIYYTYCPEKQKAIVGHLPSHLDTSQTAKL